MRQALIYLVAAGLFGGALYLSSNEPIKPAQMPKEKPENLQVATVAGGCFWCVEAVFERIDGVYSVTSGYTGGHVEDPTYEQVIGKRTGHAEAVRIEYDGDKLGYDELLSLFWQAHDPTTLNRQGNDVGPQYRSAIFVHSPEQREIAEQSKKVAQKDFVVPIVTEISDAGTFYPAEDYHQDFFDNNPNNGYCRYVIAPKLRKLNLAQ